MLAACGNNRCDVIYLINWQFGEDISFVFQLMLSFWSLVDSGVGFHSGLWSIYCVSMVFIANAVILFYENRKQRLYKKIFKPERQYRKVSCKTIEKATPWEPVCKLLGHGGRLELYITKRHFNICTYSRNVFVRDHSNESSLHVWISLFI